MASERERSLAEWVERLSVGRGRLVAYICDRCGGSGSLVAEVAHAQDCPVLVARAVLDEAVEERKP